MTTEPEITVIMPVYNVEEYISKSIESVLAQTYSDFELIVVNDGSTDASRDIIEGFMLSDDRIKLIDKLNGGLSSARNAGLDAMSGKYVTFIDSDDYIDSDYLQTLHELIVRDKVDIAVCDYKCVYGDVPDFSSKKTGKTLIYPAKKHVRDMFGPRMVGAYAWGKLFKAEQFSGIRFPEGRLYEDIFTIPYVMYPAAQIAYICTSLYYYRKRKGSILSTYNPQRKDEIYAIGAIVDFAVSKGDRLLAWYARINEIRSYIEIRHRFKKKEFDFSSVRNDFKGRIKTDVLKILFPF